MTEIEKWLEDRIILKVYKGSYAYGTNHADSDVDIGGICIPPKQYLYGFYSFEQYESKNYTHYTGYKKTGQGADTVIYGLHKFVKLACNCNPNIIETLFTNPTHILHSNYLGNMLLENRKLFFTKKAKDTFGGYAFSQLRRLNNKLPMEKTKTRQLNLENKENHLKVRTIKIKHKLTQLFLQEELSQEDIKEIWELRNENDKINTRMAAVKEERAEIDRLMGGGNHNHHGSHAGLIEKYGYDVKHAMHLIRLLHMGLEILTEGECRVLRPDKNYLLAIRYGEYTLEQIQQESDKLFRLLDEAYVNSKLPDTPDIDKVNQLLMDITEASFDKSAWLI